MSVYGTKASPRVLVQENVLDAVTDQTKFSFNYLNLVESDDNISIQYYYPSYTLWATTKGTNEDIAKGAFSSSSLYTAGVEVQWRVIRTGSEQSETTIGDVVYKVGSTTILYSPTEKMNGSSQKHYTFVVFGSGTTLSHVMIEHEAQIQ